MKKEKKKKTIGFFSKSRAYQITTILIAIYLGVSAAMLSYTQVFYQADEALTNILYKYNPFEKADERITIIAIDETTKGIYGDNNNWSRSEYAKLIEQLSKDGATVIGLDVNLSREGGDKEGDLALAEACRQAGNVVVPVNTSFLELETEIAFENENTSIGEEFKEKVPTFESNPFSFRNPSPIRFNENMMEMEARVEYPYEELREVTTLGAVNAIQKSVDGTIRNAALSIAFTGDDVQDAFAVAIYKLYQKANHEEFVLPEIGENGLFGFNSLWNTESYQRISYADLMDGNYDSKLISGKMVLVGEYDPIAYSNPREFLESRLSYQEVMVNASILQAIISDKVVVDVDALFQALFYGITIAVFYILFASRKRLLALVGQLCWGVICFSIAFGLNAKGYRFMLLIPLLFTFVSTIFFLLQHMLMHLVERKRMEATLKMYVDSKVVDQLEEVAPFALTKVSERKNIAVLFVDIRGFTTMSEQLEPEQVVTVLNEYFTLVYASIQAWNGTLDKFIGDAAMAIFNAPTDDEDYIFHAVCAADDIQKGFEGITAKYKELYGREIHVGIGINAGEAIVGNIGCLRRMDYTAIGDTVNTASRLESKSAPDQILISESVRAAIEERVETQFVGALELKGKSQSVDAFCVTDIQKPKAPNAKARKEFINEARLLYSKVGSNFKVSELRKKV